MTVFRKLLELVEVLVVTSVVLGCREQTLKYTPDRRLALLLDGGSSGTKLLVFSWLPKPIRHNDPDVTMLYSHKFKPSLDSFSIKNNVSHIPQYISNIINCAKQLIGEDIYKETPVYLFTTAGARFLNGSDSLDVINAVRSTLLNKAINPFIFKRQHARVFSGEEEGAYAWLAANYVLGHLRTEAIKDDLVGILEMGGGSTQISFLPKNPVYANMYTVNFNKHSYHLYSHSYLNYGQNYMDVRINSYIARRASTRTNITNPCMLKGDTRTFSFLKRSFTIHGGGDWQQCEKIIRYYLKTANKTNCFPKPCAIGHTYQPAVQPNTFYAISGYYYPPKYLGAISSTGGLNPSVLRLKARDYCGNTMEDNMRTHKISAKYASAQCWMGLYLPILIIEAYRFSPETKNIILANAVNKSQISWPLGAILNEIQNLEPRPRDLPPSSSTKLTGSVYKIVYTNLALLFLLNLALFS